MIKPGSAHTPVVMLMLLICMGSLIMLSTVAVVSTTTGGHIGITIENDFLPDQVEFEEEHFIGAVHMRSSFDLNAAKTEHLSLVYQTVYSAPLSPPPR
jgi:hypothetical protein